MRESINDDLQLSWSVSDNVADSKTSVDHNYFTFQSPEHIEVYSDGGGSKSSKSHRIDDRGDKISYLTGVDAKVVGSETLSNESPRRTTSVPAVDYCVLAFEIIR